MQLVCQMRKHMINNVIFDLHGNLTKEQRDFLWGYCNMKIVMQGITSAGRHYHPAYSLVEDSNCLAASRALPDSRCRHAAIEAPYSHY
jgi:hypothetical protein